jgi:hypothetical protein
MHNGFGMFNIYERIISHTFVGGFVILVLLSAYVLSIGIYDGIVCQYNTNQQYQVANVSSSSSPFTGLLEAHVVVVPPVVPASYNVAS